MISTGKLQKAYLDFGEGSDDGKKGGGDKFEFLFNPKELTVSKKLKVQQTTTKTPTPGQYIGTEPQSMVVELFVDQSLTKGTKVTDYVHKLFAKLEPTPKSQDDKPLPPFCSFGWGPETYLSDAIVKSVQAKYTQFDKDGTVLRAVCTVTLEEQRYKKPATNPTSGSPDTQVERIMHPGDSIASIAYQELGSANLWRAIAEANGIDDPLRVPPGRSILIPTARSLGAGSQN